MWLAAMLHSELHTRRLPFIAITTVFLVRLQKEELTSGAMFIRTREKEDERAEEELSQEKKNNFFVGHSSSEALDTTA